jgi:hypothetical protein
MDVADKCPHKYNKEDYKYIYTSTIYEHGWNIKLYNYKWLL